MAVIYHPHALERMAERGATEDEVLKTLETGKISIAKFGRRMYSMSFPFGNYWRSQFYKGKHIDAYVADDEENIIVITIIVKYS
jgi:hypothetical protein